MPGSGSQDGDEGQTGAEEDPAANVEDGVLTSPPPDEGPEIVGTVLLPGEAGLLPRPPGHQAAALALAGLVVPVEIFLIFTQSFRLKIFQFQRARLGWGNLVPHTT